MALPDLLASAAPPAPRDWDLLPDDSGTVFLVPVSAIDCAGCDLDFRAADADLAPLWAGETLATWVDQSAGSIRVQIPASNIAALCASCAPGDAQVVVGHYRLQVVSGDERRTLIHGALRASYAVRS